MESTELRWLTIAEAACHARISRTTLYKLMAQGKLTPRKLGARTLLARQELDQLIETGIARANKRGSR
jgi:excisionase family DNA binding protein